MNDEVYLKIEKLKNDLFNEPVIIEYIKLANLIRNSGYIQNLLVNKYYFQQLNVQQPKNEEYKKEYAKYVNLYATNPIVENYYSVKQEAYMLISMIKDELSL